MKSRFFYIVLAIILVLLVIPFSRPAGLFGHLLSTFILAMIPLSCVMALTANRRNALIIVLFATPFVVLDGLNFVLANQHLLIVKLSFASILYFYIVFLLVKHLLSIKVVTADMIFCAISTYLLIGIGWAGIYHIVETLAPGSFSIHHETDLLYFSFIALTTVGFGDVLPLSVLSKRLVIFEATMGSIYMAVIVAMIVGRYMSIQTEQGAESESSLKK